jgi:hypothetical protein
LIEHWNGSGWSITSSPNVGANSNELNDVAVVSASNAWAIGDVINGSYQTLTEEYS